ncbi:MAG: folylpolyglutamate synthase/dihydrofolate synthase family protein [Pseudomonadota bacterium]|nr:folylpolyglutamate synthase/dihydrofolate synthase family protein [Pseudomonadota bacterium]
MSRSIFDALDETIPVSIDLNLVRMARLLKALGSPQRHMPPAVHVAGTNGKGSVIAFLRSILEEAGYRVHVYTSPHLVCYNERIRLNGRLIADEDLQCFLRTCIRLNRRRPITFFEITTAAAFLAFSQTPADICLIETGLGGRLDATNLIEHPEVSILTPISIDHEFYLGRGLNRIANEKAGILKCGRPAIISKQSAQSSRVLERVARRKGVPLWRCGREWKVSHRKFGSIFQSLSSRRMLPLPGLLGPHQRDNAAVAVAALDLLDHFPVPSRAVRRGIARVKWPARFQALGPGALTNLVGPGTNIWVDGGHNAAAGEALADAIRSNFGGDPVHVILGMLKTKLPADFIAPLLPHVQKVYPVSLDGDAGLAESSLAAQLREVSVPVLRTGSLEAAVQHAGFEGVKNIVICGSLYLAGQALSMNDECID